MFSEAATSRVARLGSLPDLNLLDYSIWSVVERVTNRCLNVRLRTAIEAAFVGMDSITLQRACERFKPIEAIIQTNGGYIE